MYIYIYNNNIMYKYIIGTKRVICMYKFCICTVIGHALPAILTGTTRGLAVVPGRGIQMCLAVPGGLSNITASASAGRRRNSLRWVHLGEIAIPKSETRLGRNSGQILM